MALWDAADLLDRVKFHANRPTTDESMTDANWYTLLSDAQQRWMRVMASIVPDSQVGAPVALTEATPGQVWTFPVTPYGHLEIRHGRAGQLLTVGADYLDSTDLVWELDQVRVPSGRTRTFASGLYARYVAEPVQISAATAPVLMPPPARVLLVYDAVAQWAERGGHRDPSPFRAKLQAAWAGDPAFPGDVGICGALRTQVHGQGLDAGAHGGTWWRSADLTG
jgi:hypothetical protein